jgi:hypothetical protein
VAYFQAPMFGDWLPGAPIHLHGGQFEDFKFLLDIVGGLAIPTIESFFQSVGTWRVGRYSSGG